MQLHQLTIQVGRTTRGGGKGKGRSERIYGKRDVQWQNPWDLFVAAWWQGRRGFPRVDKPAMLITQTCLNEVVNRALVGDAAQLLLSSLAADTQKMYLEEWEMWTRFCDTMGISPWANTAAHNWDQDILCFLTRDHTVMKNG